MSSDPAWGSLYGELAQANEQRLDPKLQAHLSAWGLTFEPDQWGFDYVEMEGLYYQPVAPSPDAPSALIFPVYDDFELIDLVAMRLRDRRVALRRGIADAVGREWLEHAADRQEEVRLRGDPLVWMRRGGVGAVILDWQATPHLLQGIPSVLCDSRSLAARVHATTRRMTHPPRIRFIQWRTSHDRSTRST